MTRFYHDVTCIAAAALVTLVLGLGFVQSTATTPFNVLPAQTQGA
jgi:hypothetical protein